MSVAFISTCSFVISISSSFLISAFSVVDISFTFHLVVHPLFKCHWHFEGQYQELSQLYPLL